MIRGRIEKALSGFYYVNTGAETLQCRARGKFRREGLSPLVGDWVQVRELGGGEGFVEAVEPRRNAFDRPAAANIDQLVIIASAALPVTDPYLIDRISAIAALKDCRVLLCLNKCDLDPAEELYGIYSGSAIRVLRVSAVTGQGIDELRRELPREYIGPEDVFASLNTEPCGKHYRHAEKGGGQLLLCTAGEGWYQEEGKAPVSLSEGSVVMIPANVKHWHGAAKGSWFSHLAVEVPGENCSNEWQEPVTDEQYYAVE